MSAITTLVAEQQSEQSDMVVVGQKYKGLVPELRELEIEDDSDYAYAGGLAKELAAARKEVDARRKKVTDPLNAALKAFGSWYKPALEAITEGEVIIRQKISEYGLKKRVAEEEAARRVAEAAALGDFDAAHEASKELVSAPILKGVSVGDAWEASVTDASLVPREFLVVNESALKAYAKAFKSNEPAPVPGVRFIRVANLRVTSK